MGNDTRRGGRGRTAVAALLVTLVAVLAPCTIAARWAHDEVTDTDRYVETVAPLADDPAIQAAVTRRVTDEILRRLGDLRQPSDPSISSFTRRLNSMAYSIGSSFVKTSRKPWMTRFWASFSVRPRLMR